MIKYVVICEDNKDFYREFNTEEEAKCELESINKYNEWLYDKYTKLCKVLDRLTIPEYQSSDFYTNFFIYTYWQASKKNIHKYVEKYYENIINETCFEYDNEIVDIIYSKCISSDECLYNYSYITKEIN